MGQRGVTPTGAARAELARRAYQMAIRRVTFTEIAGHLDIKRGFASKLVREEQERLWMDRDIEELHAEQRRAISTYEEVIRGAWQRLARIQDASLNVSGLFNVIIAAQSKIDEITGVRAAVASEIQMTMKISHRKEVNYDDLFRQTETYLIGYNEASGDRKRLDTDPADG